MASISSGAAAGERWSLDRQTIVRRLLCADVRYEGSYGIRHHTVRELARFQRARNV
jgi:hypothetical protein